MDLPYGDKRNAAWVTNVGLVTSDGPHGPDVMSAEWTHMVSYKPGLIAVCIGPSHATYDNIVQTKQFGVNLAAADQNALASIAGGSSGKEVNKIWALEELGFAFYEATKISVLMVEAVALNAECKLHEKIELGDHTMFVGYVLEASINGKESLAYHAGKYWLLEREVTKPPLKERERIGKVIEKHRR